MYNVDVRENGLCISVEEDIGQFRDCMEFLSLDTLLTGENSVIASDIGIFACDTLTGAVPPDDD